MTRRRNGASQSSQTRHSATSRVRLPMQSTKPPASAVGARARQALPWAMHSARSSAPNGRSSARPEKWLAPTACRPPRGIELGERIRQAEDQHAVMQERQHHRDEGGFLPAVQACRGGEDARRLAGERPAVPQERGAVEEVLERRGHVAEPRRAAEREAGAFLQIAQLAIRRALRRDGFLVANVGKYARHRAHPGCGAGNALDALARKSAMRRTEPPTL